MNTKNGIHTKHRILSPLLFVRNATLIGANFCSLCFGKSKGNLQCLSASEWVASLSVSPNERDRTVSDTDCYRETNYPGQWGQASDSIITGSLALQQPYAWVWPPVTQQLGTGDEREAELGHGGGSQGVLIHQDPMSCLVPDSGASLWAAESRSWGLIWPSWRKRAIRVQLVQTEVK